MQAKVALGHYVIFPKARAGAGALGFDEQDITECVCALTPSEFYKSMPAEKAPGTFQDVYKTTWAGQPIYTKLTLGAPARKTVVISFKRDESAPAEAEGQS